MNGAIDDAFISALVKTTLLLHRSTNALNATVNTKDGVVAVEARCSMPRKKIWRRNWCATSAASGGW